jgi:hypothetical protein
VELREAVDRLRYELYRAEGFSDDDLNVPLPPPGTREYASFLDYLSELADKRTPEIVRGFRSALSRSLQIFARAVPNHRTGPFTAQVVDFVPDIGRLIEDMAEPFLRGDPNLFRRLRTRIRENTERVGKVRPLKFAAHSQARETVAAYFGGTPLEQLFLAEIPVPFPTENRYADNPLTPKISLDELKAIGISKLLLVFVLLLSSFTGLALVMFVLILGWLGL